MKIESVMINGSCQCGSVKYEISGTVGGIVHCRCKTCRKAHGSAFSSVASVQDCDFILFGKDNLTSYESSTGKYRYFCLNCGSQIYAKRADTSHIVLRLGSLDSDIESAEKEHIWTSQKANWYCINSQLPEREESE
ncbi:GFA family protein [Sinobacterium caligoides]|nr:GFA family protein [Sinobacterium caligoides]